MQVQANAVGANHVAATQNNDTRIKDFTVRVRCRGLTRPKISDRWRERASLQVECGSHGKRERGAASGSLHRLVRPLV